MAPDDDDRRRQYAREDRIQADKIAAERSSEVNRALGKGNLAKAAWLTRVPPEGAGSDDAGGSERRGPLTADEEFAKHKDRLLFQLERADNFMPRELLDGWARRIEPLDLALPGRGLMIMELIGQEYRNAVSRYKPPAKEGPDYVEWEKRELAIDGEIEWLSAWFLDAPRT